MILKAPIGETFKQVNRGEKFGDIYASRNIDLENKWGKVISSSPVLAETLSTDDTTRPQSTPFAFTKNRGSISSLTLDRFWTIASDSSGDTRLFHTSNTGSAFVLDAGSPVMGDTQDSDIISFNNKVYVASGGSLYSRSSVSTWTTVSTAIGNNNHILSVYADRLYISGDQEVKSIDTAGTLASPTATYALDIDTAGNQKLYISTMRSSQNGLWIGTVNSDGGRAKVFFWNGVDANTVEASYKIDAAGVVAMTIKNEVPYILGSNGVLFRFNGSFFKEVDRFAFGNLFTRFGNIFSRHDRFVHPNGMIVVRDEILIALNNRTGEDDVQGDPVPKRVPSGVWAWSEETGLYHKHSLSMQQDSDTITDYGQVELDEIGGLFPLYESDITDDNFDQSDFFVGYSFKSDNSTTKYAVGVNNKRNLTSGVRTFDQASLIITPFFTAEQVLENWQHFYTRMEADKVLISYRTKEYEAVEANITWVNTTSFTTTSSDFATIKTNFDNDIQYEYEGLQGDGAGQIAYITDITEAGGTYTVTLDQTITGATTNTARARFDRWIKIGEFTEDDTVPNFNPDVVSSKIQFKIYSLGDLIIENYISKSVPHEPFN